MCYFYSVQTRCIETMEQTKIYTALASIYTMDNLAALFKILLGKQDYWFPHTQHCIPLQASQAHTFLFINLLSHKNGPRFI